MQRTLYDKLWDEHVVHSENMFVTHTVDVEIAAGANELAIRFGRVPAEDIHTLALDEGSRTSAALAHLTHLTSCRFDSKPQPTAGNPQNLCELLAWRN